MAEGKVSGARGHFKLPSPVVQVIRKTEDILSSHLIVQIWPALIKFVEWNFLYLLSYVGLGYGWLLFFFTVYWISLRGDVSIHTKLARMTTAMKKREADVLSETMEAFPAWVSFPDFDRVEWINEILDQLWRNVDSYATVFIRTFIEPKLHRILDLMQLDQVSGFQIKRVDLGTIPARLNGIKVYNAKSIGIGGGRSDEILMDCDVAYDGDARVLFTLQGISAQIHTIKFRGMARIHLKPLLNRFPFVGGFDFYFLNTPKVEYSLGGIGTFGDVPGIGALVRSIVQDNIRSRFVWPNKFHLHFPLPDYQPFEKWSYMLPKPSGLLVVQLQEGRNLLKKDKHFGGSGKSDPYAIISVGERRMSFKSKYAAKTVDPVWNYSTTFLMENPSGQNLTIEVYDFDAGSADDYLGVTSIPLANILEKGGMDKWVTLSDVKHGDVHLVCKWQEAKPIAEEGKVKSVIASVFIDRCTALAGGGGGGKGLYPKCRISMNGRPDDEFQTLPKSKTENPLFEQGWMLTSNDPFEDQVWIDVFDAKSGVDASFGKVQIPLSFLLDLPKQEFFDMEFPLEGGHPNAKMSVSAKLFEI